MKWQCSALLSLNAVLTVTTHAASTTTVVWPNQRTGINAPTKAVDGNLNTYTWCTAPYNRSTAHLALDFGVLSRVNRIRIWKDAAAGNSAGTDLPKNLVISYTLDSGPVSGRSWIRVSGLGNGFDNTEFLKAAAVNADGTVSGDIHDSIGGNDGWASLTFSQVEATAIRITFSPTPGSTSYPYIHYKVHEIQVLNSVPRDDYTVWRALHFGNSYPGDHADPDHDGTVNLLEFIMGRDPMVPDSHLEPCIQVMSGDATFTYPQTTATNHDVISYVSWSHDLKHWMTGGLVYNVAAGSGDAMMIEASLVTHHDDRVFMRLEALRTGGGP